MVRGFAPDAPLLVQRDGVALDVGTIQGIHRDDGDLGVRLLLDLLADVVQLRDRGLVEHVGEVVDVVGGAKLGDRLCRKQQRERQQEDGDANRLHKLHSR